MWLLLLFTLPEEIGKLALQNAREIYAILFRAASETLLTIAADPKRLGAAIGFLAVLHTWGQNQRFALVWLLLSLPLLFFAGHKLAFQLFKRRPSRDVTTFQGAEVPPELIDRYTKARDQFGAVITELDALPLTPRTKDNQ